jgi:hypothetical protein
MNAPINFKDGVDLLGKLDIIEFSITAAISGDEGGPLTSSVNTRRNLALILSDTARTLDELAAAIDPLPANEPVPNEFPPQN